MLVNFWMISRGVLKDIREKQDNQPRGLWFVVKGLIGLVELEMVQIYGGWLTKTRTEPPKSE